MKSERHLSSFNLKNASGLFPQISSKPTRNGIKNLVASFGPKMNLHTNENMLIARKTPKQHDKKEEDKVNPSEETFTQRATEILGASSPKSNASEDGTFIDKLKVTLESKALVKMQGNEKLIAEKMRAFEANVPSKNKELQVTLEADIMSNIKEKVRTRRTEVLFKNCRSPAAAKKSAKGIVSQFSQLKNDSSRLAKNEIAVLDQLRSISRLSYFIGPTYDMISKVWVEDRHQ